MKQCLRKLPRILGGKKNVANGSPNAKQRSREALHTNWKKFYSNVLKLCYLPRKTLLTLFILWWAGKNTANKERVPETLGRKAGAEGWPGADYLQLQSIMEIRGRAAVAEGLWASICRWHALRCALCRASRTTGHLKHRAVATALQLSTEERHITNSGVGVHRAKDPSYLWEGVRSECKQ